MKRLATIAIAFLIVVFAAQYASAAGTQNITINISITAAASLTIDVVIPWDLTNKAFSTPYVSGAYLLGNDSGVNETFKVWGANSTGTHPWLMAAAPAVNTFEVQGLIGAAAAAAPAAGDFAGDDILNNATYVLATATALGNGGWSATSGADVAPAASRRLYLLFSTATGGYSSAVSIGTVVLTVSADVL